MNTKLMLVSLLIGLVTPSSVTASALYDKWEGVYVYHATIGKSSGGDAIVYGVALTVSPPSTCTVEEDGFQVMSRMSCILKTDGEVDVVFNGYLPGNATDFGYRNGEILFSLQYEAEGKTLITTWGALDPDVKTRRGRYFKRLKE